jgi:hypothetical protein
VVPRCDIDYLETFLAAAGVGTQLFCRPVSNRFNVPVFGAFQAVERVTKKKEEMV